METNNNVEGVMQTSQYISYNDFSKIKLKVGKILNAEDIEGKDKLFKLSIDLGEQDSEGNKKLRTLVAGLKLFYTKDELQNKYVIVVSNLEPRKLGSFMSEGMLLAASQTLEDGKEKVSLLQPDKDIALGSDIY
jgi:methionyl-tRNA synthetase